MSKSDSSLPGRRVDSADGGDPTERPAGPGGRFEDVKDDERIDLKEETDEG
jgi:hypothetical protein